MKFSRHVNFAILRFAYFVNFHDFSKMGILNHCYFAFLSKTHFISLPISTKQVPYISFKNDSLRVDIHTFKVKFTIYFLLDLKTFGSALKGNKLILSLLFT